MEQKALPTQTHVSWLFTRPALGHCKKRIPISVKWATESKHVHRLCFLCSSFDDEILFNIDCIISQFHLDLYALHLNIPLIEFKLFLLLTIIWIECMQLLITRAIVLFWGHVPADLKLTLKFYDKHCWVCCWSQVKLFSTSSAEAFVTLALPVTLSLPHLHACVYLSPFEHFLSVQVSFPEGSSSSNQTSRRIRRLIATMYLERGRSTLLRGECNGIGAKAPSTSTGEAAIADEPSIKSQS